VSQQKQKSNRGARASSKQLNNNKGKRSAAHRPQIYRNAKLNYNESLNADEVRDILERRKSKRDDISVKELDQLLSDYGEEKACPDLPQSEVLPEPRSVENTKVPIYGNLRVDVKDSDAIRVMSLNINGIHLWKHNNLKADRLKHVMKTYGIDVLGLQETNTNFAAMKASQTLASTLRHGADEIRSVEAQNTRELKNIGVYQPGGTAVVVREQLT
jgi:hypothetical protein